MTAEERREMQIQMANGASFDEAYQFILMVRRRAEAMKKAA